MSTSAIGDLSLTGGNCISTLACVHCCMLILHIQLILHGMEAYASISYGFSSGQQFNSDRNLSFNLLSDQRASVCCIPLGKVEEKKAMFFGGGHIIAATTGSSFFVQ